MNRHYSVLTAGDPLVPCYDFDAAIGAVCGCRTPGCTEFSTGGHSFWFRPNRDAPNRALRRRARNLDRVHARFARRAEKVSPEGVIGKPGGVRLHIGGGKDSASYRGTSSSVRGMAHVCLSERFLVDEELRRRGQPKPPDAHDRWWHRLIPNWDFGMMLVASTVWTALISWVCIGIFHLVYGLTGGGWEFRVEYLVFWGLLTLLGWAKWAEAEST